VATAVTKVKVFL